jgi:hypothetical protein
MPELFPEQRTLRARLGAHAKWGQIADADRPAQTAAARSAFENQFLTQADGDPKRAASLRKAYYARLAMKSAQARRSKAQELLVELDGGGDHAA